MSETIEYLDTPWGKEAVCKTCGTEVHWTDCYNCEDGYSHHDCGEDTCCCADPRPNVKCDICNGEGGWFVCPTCISSKKTVDSDIERKKQ